MYGNEIWATDAEVRRKLNAVEEIDYLKTNVRLTRLETVCGEEISKCSRQNFKEGTKMVWPLNENGRQQVAQINIPVHSTR